MHQFWKVTRERCSRFRLNRNLVAIAKNNRAKSVPLRLELPAITLWNLVNAVRFHRREGRADGKRHFFLFSQFILSAAKDLRCNSCAENRSPSCSTGDPSLCSG